MTSESGTPEGRRWLVEPPAADQILFQFGTGDDVEVTPAVQEALGQLIQALRGADVQGFVYDPGCTKRDMTCTVNGKCATEWQHPTCEADYHCQIGKIM